MEETLWSMSQSSRALRELRKDISRVWNDTAAREINSRYLDSHEIDDQQMIAAINVQNDFLHKTQQEIEYAREYARKIDECAATAAEKLKFAEQDIASAYSDYDIYVQYNSDARSKFPLIAKLIRDADSVCG